MAINIDELIKNEFWKRKIYTVMKVRDADKDGLISKADYELLYQGYKDMGASAEDLKRLEKVHVLVWKSIGVDDNIEQTYEQAVANHAKILAKVKDNISEVFAAQFEVIDTDRNGEISFQEWVEIYKVIGIDSEHARASFSAMDTNGDGVVSKEEYEAYAKEFFFTAEDKLHSSIMYGPLIDPTELPNTH